MRLFLLLTITLTFTACAKHEPDDFLIDGWSKKSVLESLGKPMTDFEIDGLGLKDPRHMGPKPSFYASVADGDKFEVWLYEVTEDRAAAVYLDESGTVAEVVIFRTDLVY